jgi:hypothetical protein
MDTLGGGKSHSLEKLFRYETKSMGDQKPMTSIVSNLLRLIVVVVIASSPGLARAGEFGTKDEAKALVEKAVEFLRANGKDKAIAEFNAKPGPFVDRDLYIVMANLSDGIRVAHGFNPKMIGKSLTEFKDVEGKPYGLEILDVAKTKGSGWVDYKFSNPITKKISDKTSYLVRVDDVVIFAGAYKQ